MSASATCAAAACCHHRTHGGVESPPWNDDLACATPGQAARTSATADCHRPVRTQQPELPPLVLHHCRHWRWQIFLLLEDQWQQHC
jgi:hypothetical protein